MLVKMGKAPGRSSGLLWALGVGEPGDPVPELLEGKPTGLCQASFLTMAVSGSEPHGCTSLGAPCPAL